MKRDQFNRTGMFNTVSAYMDQNKSIWGGVKAIADTVSEVNAGIAAVDAAARKQQAPTSSATEEKAQVQLSLEEKTLELADQLSALAEKNQDAKLAAEAEFTLSSLDKLPDDELEETGKSVSALATANLAALVDYSIAPADVTALDHLTTQFHGVKSAPRKVVAGRAGQTSTLPDLISNTTSLLRNRLDKQMRKFKKSNPEFYAGYQSARVTVDRAAAAAAARRPRPHLPIRRPLRRNSWRGYWVRHPRCQAEPFELGTCILPGKARRIRTRPKSSLKPQAGNDRKRFGFRPDKVEQASSLR